MGREPQPGQRRQVLFPMNHYQDPLNLLALQKGQAVNTQIDTGGGDVMDHDLHKADRDIHINTVAPKPPFWRRPARVNLILAVIGLIAAVLAIPGISDTASDVFRSPSFAPAADTETLIVIATFDETGTTQTESHTKIRRAIEAAARKLGLDTLRVEEDPTVLKADERQQAETLGNLHDASIIIWGEDTGVQVLVNFLKLKQPDFDPAEIRINKTQRTAVANPSAYSAFIVSDLPGQLTFLAYFAVEQSLTQPIFEKTELPVNGVPR